MSTTCAIRRLKSFGQFIAGAWNTGTGTELVSTCPVDQSVVYQGNAADASQVDDAVSAARKAVESWSCLSSEERIGIVLRCAALVEEKTDELAELISAETGKPLWESKTEVAGVIRKAEVSVEAFQQRRDTTSFEMGDMQAVTRYKPVGVMAVIGPFNFPSHLPNGHIVPALIAGNTVVFKPSEQTPAVGQWMVQQWQEAGLPAGVLNLVQGGREVGVHLASHRQIDGLLFTGSSTAGRALHRVFGDHPEKILALEMGGNGPLIVHEAHDLTAAAYMTINSAFITSGQRCTCARRLIVVENEQTQPFLDELVAMMSRLRIGPFTRAPEPFASTVISADQGRRLLDGQQSLIARNATPVVEMHPLEGNDALLSPGLIDVTEVHARPDEENFGPLLNLIRVKDFEAAIDEANDTAYGLSAGLLSSSPERYQQFIRRIRAGIVNWNRQTTGASGRMPFGGCGLSGNHRPSAWHAADYCSYPVASLEAAKLELPADLTPGIDI